MKPEWSTRLWSVVRVALAIAVLAVLASSGLLEWPHLRGLRRAWPLTLAALALLLAGFVMTSWRFCLLTAPSGLHMPLSRSFRLSMIGNAANFVLPTVGSDLVRLWYSTGGKSGRRTEVGTIVLLDRVLGLLGLLLLPLVLTPFFLDVVRASSVIQWMLGVAAGAAAALTTCILLALSRRGLASGPVRLALRLVPLRGYPERVLRTIHDYRGAPGALIRGVLWSLAANLCAVTCIVCLQLAILPGSAALLGGFLTSITFVLNNVPITPGGIGFTEAAVASLYRMAGVEGGAAAMLGMRLLFLALTPIGVALYLHDTRLLRAHGAAVPGAVGEA